MTTEQPTTVIRVTPAGRGAIATLVVSGPAALRAVTECFRPRTRQSQGILPIGRICLGVWSAGSASHTATNSPDSPVEVGEELLVCRVAEQTIEIHGHGGEAAIGAILASLVAHGCRERPWTAWQASADEPAWQQQARVALAQATTDRVLRVLLDQYQGALSREIQHSLTDLDRNDAAAAQQRLRPLLDRAHFGQHLLEPWRVVLAGPPNVGKSSLINALVGFQRTVVFDQPGTTRDVVQVRTAVEGWPVELSDTAGLHAGADQLEQLGMERARAQLRHSDLIVWVFDIETPLASVAHFLAEPLRSIVVLNQCDRLADLSPDHCWVDAAADCPVVVTSASTGHGINTLLSAIAQRLIERPPPPGAAVPFRPEQIATLRQAAALLEVADLPGARAQLALLLA